MAAAGAWRLFYLVSMLGGRAAATADVSTDGGVLVRP